MKPITAIVLGAGQRGANVYAAYALSFPNELKIVGVAEPRADRRAAFAKEHGIPESAALQAGRTRSDRTNSQTVYLSAHRIGCTSSRSCRRWKRAMTCCAKSR